MFEKTYLIVALLGLLPAALIAIPTLLPIFRGEGLKVAGRGVRVSGAGLFFSLLVWCYVMVQGTVDSGWVYLDRFSALILVMVSFLGLIVSKYTVNHLAGDVEQSKFVRRLLLTVASVELLVVSGNLLFFAIAWAATSVALHRLLTFYPDRPGAKLAAKKRFLFSRVGDVCFVVVVYLIAKTYGTLEFGEIFTQVNQGQKVPMAVPIFLVMAALLKSAQMPFHSWLPETMESPTPVSALMHAGIVNAGGFLVIRLHPLVEKSVFAMDLLIVVGGITAVTASLVMITQPSIKRLLAWSTISQMGFMMLQCGLGAFGLAALHILAHSLYKAHSFLSAGGVVERSLKRTVYTPPQMSHWALAFGVGLALVMLALWVSGFLAHLDASIVVLFSVLVLAVSQLIASSQVRFQPGEKLKNGIGVSLMVIAIVVGLHFLVEFYFHPVLHHQSVEHSLLGYIVMILVPVLLGVVIFLQSQLAKGTKSPLLRRIYIHAYHGFYFGTWLARILGVKGRSKPL